MAAAAVLPMPIPGLHHPPTLGELDIATMAYNSLPPDNDNLPQIPEKVINDLQQLIKMFGVEEKFGVHLLHNHLTLGHGTVMLGRNLTAFPACWVRPTPLSQLDPTKIHGHIFVMNADGNFCPYEFREDPPTPMSVSDDAFVTAFKAYLSCHGLTKILGLEMAPKTNLVELILDKNFGTVVMEPKHSTDAQSGEAPPNRQTAWVGVEELKGNVVSHQERINNLPHYMATDSKRDPWEEDEKFVLDTLRKNNAIM